MMDAEHKRGSEAGFTLIEVLLSVVISGILISALSLGILTYIKGASATTALLTETGELQIAASHFASDVQSAESLTVPPTGVCNTTPTTPGVAMVDLAWRDWTTPTAFTPVQVSYYYNSATNELHRVVCRNGVVQKNTLVSHVQPAAATPASPLPSVRCDGVACTSTTPRQVDLKFSVCIVDPLNACRNDPIPATLTGVRRL
jgi:prepilin-type N-terminal cleavage/methylation domain-containing protein